MRVDLSATESEVCSNSLLGVGNVVQREVISDLNIVMLDMIDEPTLDHHQDIRSIERLAAHQIKVQRGVLGKNIVVRTDMALENSRW